MPEELEFTTRLQSSVSPSPSSKGVFEIFAITAGSGNGWEFSPEVLKDSLPLWNNAECFIDHSFYSHSIKDLAGVCSSPAWDDAHKGIRLTLKAFGPSADLLTQLGRDILAADPKPDIGFSADISFTAQGRKVQLITRVHSVDLVFDPARGGSFIRSLNSKRKVFQMPDPDVPETQEVNAKQQDSSQKGGDLSLSPDAQAIRSLLGEASRLEAIQNDAAQARQLRTELCTHLLNSALATSSLPNPVKDRIRKRFSGQVFEPADLQAEIDDARDMVSQLSAGSTVQGPRITGMYSSEDQIQAAVDDLLGAPREPASAKLAVHRLTGIRELYMSLTGDYDLHGGYHRDRVALATTADFTGLVKNAMNKIVVNTWEQLGRAGYDWWARISRQEHFGSLQDITGTLIGTVGTLPVVAEGAEYTELPIGDSPETASFVKYGGYIPLTLELIDRDQTRKLAAYPRELAAAGLRKISALVAAIFTDNSGIGPTMADGGALFNNTAVTSAGGHANLLTTALSATQWEVVSAAVYNQPMLIKNAAGYYGTGPKLAINPRFCLVPRALQLTAMKILYPSLENAANIHSENLQRGQPGDVITVPEWTDSNDWAAVCDPSIAPAIYVGERFGIMPEVFIAGDELSPAVFTNDEHRLKVRHFLAVWVNDVRPLHKSNV